MATSTRPQGLKRFNLLENGQLLPLIVVVIVVGLSVIPLLGMLLATFRPADTLPLDASGLWTLEHYPRVFLDTKTYAILWDTVAYAVATMAVSLPLALFFAWLVDRTDMRGRGVFYTLMFIPLVMPAFMIAIGWIQLLGPNNGALNVYARDIFNLVATRGPLNVYSFWGLVIVTAMAVVPTMWLLLLGLFRNMDASLEDAALTSGASPLGVFRRITLPLLRPGVLTVAVYYTLVLTEVFEVPLILGPTAGVNVLSVHIYEQTTDPELGLPVYGLAATFAIIALILGAILIAIYLWAVRQQHKFAVVTGKGFRPRTVRLGNWTYLCWGIVAAYLIVAVVLPTSIVFWNSLSAFPSVPSMQSLQRLSLDNYRELFGGGGLTRMVKNTAIVAAASSTTTMVLAAIVAWLTVRRPSNLTRALNAVTFLPLAIPTPVVALSILLLYIRSPIPIYGTLWILIIAFTTRYLALGTRLMHSAQLQIDKSLDEAAYTSGAGPMKTFYHVNLKLMIPAFSNGWIWVFAHAVRDFAIPLFLATAGTRMIANVVFLNYSTGQQNIAVTYLVLLFGVVVIMAALARLTVTSGRVQR